MLPLVLEGLNKAYASTVLLGEETALLVQDAMELRLVDHVAVKGRERAMRVYELLGEKDRVPAQRLQAARAYERALEQINSDRSRRPPRASTPRASCSEAPTRPEHNPRRTLPRLPRQPARRGLGRQPRHGDQVAFLGLFPRSSFLGRFAQTSLARARMSASHCDKTLPCSCPRSKVE